MMLARTKCVEIGEDDMTVSSFESWSSMCMVWDEAFEDGDGCCLSHSHQSCWCCSGCHCCFL